ncbi:MAG TPA: efflux RND transporter periplasmic adaptor subunit [Longimicrobiales bacterium]|nr:efflux RND transporter periplasmic adaptor subunit [Longimicrobiales bacterium]
MTRNRITVFLGIGAGVLALSFAALLTVRSRVTQQNDGQTADAMQGMDMGGMDMGGTAAEGSIHLTANEIGTFGITFGTVEVRSLSIPVRTVGLVEFDETRMTYVAPKFGGWVEKLHVDFTGQPVRQGQPLLDIYSPELVTAQEELLLAARLADSVGTSAVANVAGDARDLVESARRRLRYWDITDEQIRSLVETGEVRKTLTLYSPVSGIVMEKQVFAGQAFQPGKDLYKIADLSEVWISAEVFEADVPLVREGMPAEITIPAFPGRVLRGRIAYVYPTLEDRTRSMRARITLANPGALLKPGMYATVNLLASLGDALTVPVTAVLHSGERAIAFVDMGDGAIMPHELRLGARGREYIQVLEGLVPGQRVVTSAQFLLDSESNLAEVMKAMVTQMNTSDMGSMDMGGMEGMGQPRPDTMEMPGMKRED